MLLFHYLINNLMSLPREILSIITHLFVVMDNKLILAKRMATYDHNTTHIFIRSVAVINKKGVLEVTIKFIKACKYFLTAVVGIVGQHCGNLVYVVNGD